MTQGIIVLCPKGSRAMETEWCQTASVFEFADRRFSARRPAVDLWQPTILRIPTNATKLRLWIETFLDFNIGTPMLQERQNANA
jgi:hypothetical protein